jgi:hypothetical protein
MSDHTDALFTYLVTPNPVPGVRAGDPPVTLTITVANWTGTDQPCTSISFTVPASGDDALTDNPYSLNAAAVAGTPSDVQWDPIGALKMQPRSGPPVLKAGESIAFTVTGLKVKESGGQGISNIVVSEVTDAPRATTIQVVRDNAGLAITSFTASPNLVNRGERVDLAWTTTGADRCIIVDEGRPVTVAANGTYLVTPMKTTRYILRAQASGAYHHDQMLTVHVRA